MVNSLITLAHGGKLKYRGISPWNSNPRKCWYHSKLQWYFYNIGPRPPEEAFSFEQKTF
jgi:hypothetical protein